MLSSGNSALESRTTAYFFFVFFFVLVVFFFALLLVAVLVDFFLPNADAQLLLYSLLVRLRKMVMMYSLIQVKSQLFDRPRLYFITAFNRLLVNVC